jgi:hypothetical protein
MSLMHYYPQPRPFTTFEWARILEACHNILVSEVGSTVVVLRHDSEEIELKGIGPRDGSFVLCRDGPNHPMKDQWCTTDSPVYNNAICILLIAINDIAPLALRITSDAEWDNEKDGWVEARRMYEHVFGTAAATCPFAPSDKEWGPEEYLPDFFPPEASRASTREGQAEVC